MDNCLTATATTATTGKLAITTNGGLTTHITNLMITSTTVHPNIITAASTSQLELRDIDRHAAHDSLMKLLNGSMSFPDGVDLSEWPVSYY